MKLKYWQIKLRSDNSVTIETGYLNIESCDKLYKFTNPVSAQEFYFQKLHAMNSDYNYIPWIDEMIIGVRVNKHFEPKLDLVELWREIQEVIVYTQVDTSQKVEKETDLFQSVSWVQTFVVDTEPTLIAIRSYLLRYGEADIMLIH